MFDVLFPLFIDISYSNERATCMNRFRLNKSGGRCRNTSDATHSRSSSSLQPEQVPIDSEGFLRQGLLPARDALSSRLISEQVGTTSLRTAR